MSNDRPIRRYTRRQALAALAASGAAFFGTTLLRENVTSVSAADRSSYNVKDFGAVGDGGTDDTTAIQSAFQAANRNGGLVIFPFGRYYVKSQLSLVVQKGVTVVGNNATIVRSYADLLGGEECIFHFAKGRLPSIRATADVVAGSDLIELASTTNLVKDMSILIASSEVYSLRNNVASQAYFKGFITKISEVAPGRIRTVNTIPHTISAAGQLTIQPIENESLFDIGNISFEWVGVPAPNQLSIGLSLDTMSNVIVNKVGFQNTTLAGLRLNNVYNANISDVIGSTAPMDNQLNYGVLASSIYFSTFTNLYVNSHRHALSLSGTPSSGIKIDKCHLYSTASQSGRSFDAHCGDSAIIVNSVLPQGVNIAGGNYVFENCDLSNNQNNPSVFLRRDLSFQKSLIVRNCRIKMVPSLSDGFIYTLNPQPDLRDCGDFIFENNEIIGVPFGGLVALFNLSNHFQSFGLWQIRNNLVKTRVSGVIMVSGSAVQSAIKGKLIVQGNRFSAADFVIGPTLRNIFTDIDIRDNRPLNDKDSFTIIVDANTDVNVIQNIVTEALIIRNNQGKTVVRGNEVKYSTKNPAANIFTGNLDLALIDNTTYSSPNAMYGYNIDKSSVYLHNNRNLSTDGEEGRLYYGIPAKRIDSVNVGRATLPSHALNRSALIRTGQSTPGETPDFLGQIYIDTGKGTVYIAVGTKSAADFKQLT